MHNTSYTKIKAKSEKYTKSFLGCTGSRYFSSSDPFAIENDCTQSSEHSCVSVSVVASVLLLLLMSFVRCAVGRWFFYFILFYVFFSAFAFESALRVSTHNSHILISGVLVLYALCNYEYTRVGMAWFGLVWLANCLCRRRSIRSSILCCVRAEFEFCVFRRFEMLFALAAHIVVLYGIFSVFAVKTSDCAQCSFLYTSEVVIK